MAIKVVVGESSVTAGQMKDFWSKVVDGTIGSENFGGFLENPHKFTREQVTIVRAINILGANKVVTAQQRFEAFNDAYLAAVAKGEVNQAIRYTKNILHGCAESNKAGHTDFRLVYLTGLSLRELREKIGVDKANQPCVYNNDWWLKPVEDRWATEKPESGYHLIDFNGRFPRTRWDVQEQEIGKLVNYERAHEAHVAEAIVTIFKITGERLLVNWYHWGRSLVSDGFRVCVGRFVTDGLGVGVVHPSVGSDDNLRVCLLRKFAI